MALVEDPALILVFAFLSAAAEAPFWAASAAAIPNLVEDDKDLGWANGLVNIGRQAGIFVGPFLGGLAAVGADVVFLSNAVSFVISALIIASVRARFSSRPQEKDKPGGFFDGVVFIARDRILRLISAAWLGIVLGLGMAMTADVVIADEFGAGRFGFGAIIAAWGGGSVVGSFMGRWLNERNEATALTFGTFAVAVTSIGVGLSPWFAMIVAIVFVMGIADGLTMVSEQSILQRRSPDAVRSRVAGSMDAVVHIGLGFSYLMAGAAVERFGAQGVYVVGGIVALLSAMILIPVFLASRRGQLITVDEPTVEMTAGGGEPVLG